jgi:fermentation-respiration switch protein FrsA (DUF1100 family)
MREDVTFWSEGDRLRGWFYRPTKDASSFPTVILSHGFSAVKEQYLDRYAEVFAAHGLGALVYDHGCFGESEGEPRYEVDPERQRRGYRDAITFVQTLDGPDPERVGLWGTSYSGGHVLVVAAQDRRVKAVVAQVPTISGSKVAVRRATSPQAAQLRKSLSDDRIARVLGKERAYVDVVTSDPHRPCALPGADSYGYFASCQTMAANWNPQVTLRSLELARANEPGAFVRLISPTPLLMIVAEDDHLTPTDLALDAFDRAGEPKALEVLAGGHFAPYTELFERSSRVAAEWFVEQLTGRPKVP